MRAGIRGKTLTSENAKTEREALNGREIARSASSICYQVIYADPPWQYDFAASTSRSIEAHYNSMTVDDLKALNVQPAENALLLLWATSPKLREALAVMDAWGFEYKTHAIWDKVKIGMGYWFRGQHELLMVGTRGKWPPPEPAQRMASVIREPRGRHSRKPDTIREWIESTWPEAKRIELFAREAWKGWDTFGNQVERTLFS